MNFKSEEVKEYLENLGIEYRFGCYSEKNPEVCHLLGDYLEAIKKDFRKSASVYRNNCDVYNYPRSCDKFGSYLMLGRGMSKKMPKEAYGYFKKGCDLSNTAACYNQAMFNLGHIKECTDYVDHKLGADTLEKSCRGGDDSSCQALAAILTTEEFKSFGVTKDMKKAFEMATIGCELRNVYCCGSLSRMYEKGDGVQQNDLLAEKYKRIGQDILNEQILKNPTIEFQQGV